MHITTQHYAEMLPLAQAAGFQNIDLGSHQLLGGRWLYTAMVHSGYTNCQLLAQYMPFEATATLASFLHAVRQELLAMAPVTYTMVGEAYLIAA